MLPRAHRLTRGSEIVATMRRGARVVTPFAIVSSRSGVSADPARIAVVVSKKVGGAAVRNRVRRRLQEICAEHLMELSAGDMVVLRALPGSSEAQWDTLRSDIRDGLRRAVKAR